MFGFAAEPIAICNEIQRSSQLIDFKRFSNLHFAITRNNCGHVFKYVKLQIFKTPLVLPIKGLIKNTIRQSIHLSNSEMPQTCKIHQY